MALIYKIHPGIGIARVGLSPNGYFLGPETPGGQQLELDINGAEAVFTGFKDANYLMRRQGARFRIFEYDRDAGGRETFRREITAADAAIRWRVRLCSRKAAGPLMDDRYIDPRDGTQIVVPHIPLPNDPMLRNQDAAIPHGYTRADLVAAVDLPISGANARPIPGAEPKAKLLGQDFYIGETRTDAAGRLVVLAGYGKSGSWTDPPAPLTDFLNNLTWYDDIADGPVDADIEFAGGNPIPVVGAWVITAPPDFAPEIEPLTSLLDIAEQALGLPLPSPLTFPQDIEPMLRRAGLIYWVNEQPVWDNVRRRTANMAQLADNSPANANRRRQVMQDLLKVEAEMREYRLTARQRAMLEAWAQGQCQPTADASRQPGRGEQLDRASLAPCIGGGFYPGIEAGVLLRSPGLYAELGRFTRGSFKDISRGEPGTDMQLSAGAISERMACPWQADFIECNTDWWPAQRPDIARHKADGTAHRSYWADPLGVGSENTPEARKNMVEQFAHLGVLVPKTVAGQTVFVQVGRHPNLDASA